MFNNNQNNKDKPKKNAQFTIINNDSTDGHGGFGIGAITLNNVSPVIVDTETGEAEVDMGALHARSAVEKRVKFVTNRDEVPDGRLYWLVWVTIDHNQDGKAYYAGVTACEMRISREDRRIRKGYKNLAEHVNLMDKSMKRKIVLDHMDEESKQILIKFLQNHDEEMWSRSADELKELSSNLS